MNKQQHLQELYQLIRTVTAYSDPHEAETILTTAFGLTAKAHEDVQRIDGQPYLRHPLAVAGILAEWRAPVQVVAAGLLADPVYPPDFRGDSFHKNFFENGNFLNWRDTFPSTHMGLR